MRQFQDVIVYIPQRKHQTWLLLTVDSKPPFNVLKTVTISFRVPIICQAYNSSLIYHFLTCLKITYRESHHVFPYYEYTDAPGRKSCPSSVISDTVMIWTANCLWIKQMNISTFYWKKEQDEFFRRFYLNIWSISFNLLSWLGKLYM